MSKADQQNSLPKCAGEILDVREEKRWFMLSAYAHIPAYHLCAHRMQKQEKKDFTEFKYPWVGFTSFTEIHPPKC